MEKNKMEENKAEMTLEEAFARLDEIVTKMEDRNLPLEHAFDYYQKGVELLKYCNTKISRVEKKVIEIQGEQENEDL